MDKEALINGYFEGSLSESQLGELEQLRQTDAAFKAKFEFERELQAALKKEERQHLKQMFTNLNKVEKPKKSKVIQLRTLLAAASIALIVGLGSWLFIFNNPQIDPDQLYNTNFAPYDNVVHPIERGNELADIKDRAFLAYENEDYDRALQLFEELDAKQKDTYIDFYKAIVFMQLGNHRESVVLLENYIANKGELKDRAIWYLALSHLKLGDVGKSREQLKKLIGLNTFKAADAQKLLEDLD